jgi:hypothetical protein
MEGVEGGEPDLAVDIVVGVVVVTQTCDIVNITPGKEHIVVCPLVEISPASLESVRKGRTLAAAALEHPPAPNVVVDIGRMASLRKSVLPKLKRRDGFSTDAARMQLAEALERKFGRFAFPDEFNDSILSKLRDRVLSAHGKPVSEHGQAYRSIMTARVTAVPGWRARGEEDRVPLHPRGRDEAGGQQRADCEDPRRARWQTGMARGLRPR